MFKYFFTILLILNSSFALAGRHKISQPGKPDVYVPTLESDGKTLIAQPASATSSGMVTTGPQSFSGNKTFTGTTSGITSSMVGLGNVTNESKSTMFSNPSFTGTTVIDTGTNRQLYIRSLDNITNRIDSYDKPITTIVPLSLGTNLLSIGDSSTGSQITLNGSAGGGAQIAFSQAGFGAPVVRNFLGSIGVNDNFWPTADGLLNLGDSSYRWKWAYNTEASFRTTSDARLKKNIELLPNGSLDKIMKLKPKTWKWIQENYSGETKGFVAQDLELVFPEMVINESNGFKNVQLGNKMLAELVKAIQEQQKQIEELKYRIDSLNKK